MNTNSYIYIIYVFIVFIAINNTAIFTKAPFGKCQTAIVKNAPKKTTKKPGDWSPIQEPDEIPLAEDNLLETIDNTASYIVSEDQKSFGQWVNLLSCIYNWIEVSKNSHKKTYLEALEDLYLISDATNILAQEFSNPRYTDAQKNKLKVTGVDLIKKLININNILLPLFEKDSSNSSSWKKAVPTTSGLNNLYKKYGQLLNQFINQDEKLNQENYENIFNTITKDLTLQEMLTNFNDIEKMIYRYNNSFFHSSQEKNVINFVKNYQSYLINRFSNGLYYYSSSYQDRFKNSKDIVIKSLLVICQKIFYKLHTILKI